MSDKEDASSKDISIAYHDFCYQCEFCGQFDSCINCRDCSKSLCTICNENHTKECSKIKVFRVQEHTYRTRKEFREEIHTCTPSGQDQEQTKRKEIHITGRPRQKEIDVPLKSVEQEVPSGTGSTNESTNEGQEQINISRRIGLRCIECLQMADKECKRMKLSTGILSMRNGDLNVRICAGFSMMTCVLQLWVVIWFTCQKIGYGTNARTTICVCFPMLLVVLFSIIELNFVFTIDTDITAAVLRVFIITNCVYSVVLVICVLVLVAIGSRRKGMYDLKPRNEQSHEIFFLRNIRN